MTSLLIIYLYLVDRCSKLSFNPDQTGVGEIFMFDNPGFVPRTHCLALLQILAKNKLSPDIFKQLKITRPPILYLEILIINRAETILEFQLVNKFFQEVV